MNFEKIPSELPSKEEQLELLQQRAGQLEEQLKRFNLPENLPDGREFLPNNLSENDKIEILIIQRQLAEIKRKQEFLNNPNEYKE